MMIMLTILQKLKLFLEACRNNFKNKKIIAIFQPHRYSRMKILYSQFIKSFYNANQVLICPVYSAGEKNKNLVFKNFVKM